MKQIPTHLIAISCPWYKCHPYFSWLKIQLSNQQKLSYKVHPGNTTAFLGQSENGIFQHAAHNWICSSDCRLGRSHPTDEPRVMFEFMGKQVWLLACVWTAWWIGNGGETPGASECLYQIVLVVTWKCIIELYYAAQMNGCYQSVQTFDEKSARRVIIKGLFQVDTCEMILNVTSMLMMEDLTVNSMQDVLS